MSSPTDRTITLLTQAVIWLLAEQPDRFGTLPQALFDAAKRSGHLFVVGVDDNE